jgi:hypothetical protein
MQRLREKLSYSNVIASVALFVAIGGTSYAAITLPRNSVGAKQLKRNAVGSSEIRPRAVTRREIRDGTIATDDLSTATRDSLRGATGPAGPAGVALRTSITATGAQTVGNATSVDPGTIGRYVVGFARNVTGCTPTASLARNNGNPPPGSSVIVSVAGGRVVVETFNSSGAATRLPFNLLVAC